jgi:hypothetical protein
MRPLLAAIVIIACLPVGSWAHPGIGIVRDSRGNIFYTDLRQVWRIATDGTKSVAVPDVHTHELCLDADDNLYGEHLRYEGDATGIWRHRVWKRAPEGTITNVIPERSGFLTDYSFVRDRAGTMYWADRGESTVIRKRATQGQTEVVATIPSRDTGWLCAAPDGTLCLSDNDDFLRIDQAGRIETLARDLATPPSGRHRVGQRLDIMGLWLDADGNLFAAVTITRQVKKITPSGDVSHFSTSSAPWRPTGGLAGADGDHWILESSGTNNVRVRHLRADGTSSVIE